MRLRTGQALTQTDLSGLEQLLLASGHGTAADLQRASEGNLATFIRSLVGLDPDAVQAAFDGFAGSGPLTVRQLQFMEHLKRHLLTDAGIVSKSSLFDDPYRGVAPGGPQDLFNESQLASVVSILDRFGAVRVA